VACRDPTDDQFLELMHRIHKGRGSLGYEVSVFEVELRPQSGMQCLGMKMTRRGGGRACYAATLYCALTHTWQIVAPPVSCLTARSGIRPSRWRAMLPR
jgi:hypothetical protein